MLTAYQAAGEHDQAAFAVTRFDDGLSIVEDTARSGTSSYIEVQNHSVQVVTVQRSYILRATLTGKCGKTP